MRNKLVFLDTETTGIGPDSRLCQVAYKFQGKETQALFKPPVPIEIEAMAVSHITNRMVENQDAFVGSEMQKMLSEILADGNILVAHNAPFDIEMLRRENLTAGEFIDTCRIAQHLDPEAVIPKYRLQYLRYYFDLDVMDVQPHSALGDIRVLEKLFDHYFGQISKELDGEEAVIKKMVELSSLPIMIKKINFGKYVGQEVAEIAKKDRGYLEWLLGEKKKSGGKDRNDENWIYTLNHYLKNQTLF
jgi:DNA polymerase III epsilon subunit-like protein